MLANDEWFRGLVVKYGPDGGLYVSDWTDTGECHNYKQVDLKNGRIYKVVYGQPKYQPVDWKKVGPEPLADLLDRRERMELPPRAAYHSRTCREQDPGSDECQWLATLKQRLADNLDSTRRLRLLWGLHATGGVDAPFLCGAVQ